MGWREGHAGRPAAAGYSAAIYNEDAYFAGYAQGDDARADEERARAEASAPPSSAHVKAR
jgi:hypothetical protein